MAALDASIINLSLPLLVNQFHVSMRDVEWVSLVYLLTLASLVITFGRIADMVGRKWMYAFGFLVFLISSVFCGLSDSLPALLVSRVFQAVGAAMLQANSVSIITGAVPSVHRGKAIGIQAAAQGIGLSLGPVLGGAILSLGSWRWLFFVNVPIGIAGTLLAVLLLPKDARKRGREPFDIWGFMFLTPALVLLIYVLNKGAAASWSPFYTLCAFASLLAFMAFIREERRSAHPLLDVTLFFNRIFSVGNVLGLLSFTSMYGVLFLSPFLIERMFHISTLMTGLYLALVPVSMTFFTPISGYLSDRLGPKKPAVWGLAAITAGCLLTGFIAGGRLEPLLIGLLLTGAGMGMFTPPNNSNVVGTVPFERLGVAGATLNMSRTLGMGMGVTISGLLYQLFSNMWDSGSGESIGAFRAAYLCMAAIGMIALIVLLLQKHQGRRYSDEYIEYYI